MPAWTGEIEPASIEQVRLGRDGKMHTITADAGGIAEQLRGIDPNLRLRFSEAGDYYVVYYQGEDGPELVSTYQDLDGRIVKDVMRIDWENRQPGYNYAEALEKADEEAEKRFNAEQREKIGESAALLAWTMREELGYNDGKISVPKDVKD